MLLFLFFAVLLLTYSNGANDNFKGVATIWGSGFLSYNKALTLATVATFAGSVCSYFFAATLIKNFSGKGLVPDEIISQINFVLAVALAAGTTVLLATKFGFPISTTHSLVGALVGADLMAAGTQVQFSKLGKVFFIPLLLSPIVAVGATILLYIIFKKIKGNSKEKIFALPIQPTVNKLHLASAAIVSFARGLNDTPKLVSLLLICNFYKLPVNIFILAVVMALGGILNAKKVASTISKKITTLSHSQGFTANFITGILVIMASKFGLPVSTTHVSVGSIYGIGVVNKTADNKEIIKIVLSWVLTLPVAGALSALFYFLTTTINF